MFKNFIVEILHATKRMKTKDLLVEGAADIKKIIDNGTVYGTDDEISELVYRPELGKDEKPGPGKNCNWGGEREKVARADHTHKLPNPHYLKIFGFGRKDPSLEYDTLGTDKELHLTPELSGAAKEKHTDSTDKYGSATGELYGHVKLSDETELSLGEDSGVAATPAALKSLNNKFLRIDGSNQMSGTINARGNSANTAPNDIIPAMRVGSAGYISDVGIANTMAIYGQVNKNVGALAFGLDKTTILLSKSTGHLYVRNDNQALKDEGYTINGERMLVDYEVELFVEKSGKTMWTPVRSGWYRIYVVGPGGNGAAGFVKKHNGRLGKRGTNNTSTAWNAYETTEQPIGLAVPGCGGGGGGVAVTDIFVPSAPYSYIGKKNGSITVTYENDAGETVTETEDCYVETPVAKQAIIQISNAYSKVSNLFAVTGSSRRFDTDAEEADDAEESTLTIEDSPIYAFKGFPAVAGKLLALSGNNYTKKGAANMSSTLESNLGKPIMDQWYGYIVKMAFTDSQYNKSIRPGYYYIRQGKQWNAQGLQSTGAADADAMAMWACYDTSDRFVYELPQGNAKQTGSFLYLMAVAAKGAFTNAKGATITALTPAAMEKCGPAFEVGRHVGLPVIDGSNYGLYDANSGTTLYSYFDILYSAAGLGGAAQGGDVNYTGGSGVSNINTSDPYDRTGELVPMKQITDVLDNDITKTTRINQCPQYPRVGASKPTCAGNKFRIRADGYCGGVPGKKGITGEYGANGAPGGIAQIVTYDNEWNADTKKWISAKRATLFARSGYGSGLSIKEIGNYSGPKPQTSINKSAGGRGMYGGGGGGGCAIVGRNNKGAGTGITQRGGAGGKGCVVIVYFGDSLPKEQTNISGIEKPMDSNGDGYNDWLQLFLTYVKDPNGSVAELEYDPKKTVVTLYDEYPPKPESQPSEWGMGTIDPKVHRPTVVKAAKGYKGNPIYTPNDTVVTSTSDSVIMVSFAKDPSFWYNVNFIAGANGNLEGETSYVSVLRDTPTLVNWVPTEEQPTPPEGVLVVPTPVPNPGYKFSKWNYTIPKTITRSKTYTAKFIPSDEEDNDVSITTITFLPGEHGHFADNQESISEEINAGTASATCDKVPTPVADEGYVFIGWNPVLPATFSEDETYTAVYAQFIDVEFASGDNGSLHTEETGITTENITITTRDDIATEGNDKIPTPVAAEGYEFIGWSPAIPEYFTEAGTYTAMFAQSLTITILPGEHGSFQYPDDPTAQGMLIHTYNGQASSAIADAIAEAKNGLIWGGDGYRHIGWDTEIPETIADNMVITATYREIDENNPDDFVTTTLMPGYHGHFVETGKQPWAFRNAIGSSLEDVSSQVPDCDEGWEFTGYDPVVPDKALESTTHIALYKEIDEEGEPEPEESPGDPA